MKYKMTNVNKNNYLFDSIFDFPFFRFNRYNNIMRSDILETDKYYKIIIDVAGYLKEEIKISINNGYIEVFLVKDVEENNDNYLLKERTFGDFNRKFYIGNINKNNIKATLNNGLLEIIVEKIEKETEDFIEIK